MLIELSRGLLEAVRLSRSSGQIGLLPRSLVNFILARLFRANEPRTNGQVAVSSGVNLRNVPLAQECVRVCR